MVQVKKASVREAILESAFRLFSERGYTASTLTQIAESAGVSTANVYVYFKSKLEIVFSIYGPWFRERLDRLEQDALRIADPRKRLRYIMMALWREIPAENGGFAKNLMQALASATAEDRYDPVVLEAGKEKVAGMIQAVLQQAGRPPLNAAALAHVIFMAFDGFALHVRLDSGSACSNAMVEAFCDLLMPKEGEERARPQPVRTTRRTRLSGASAP